MNVQCVNVYYASSISQPVCKANHSQKIATKFIGPTKLVHARCVNNSHRGRGKGGEAILQGHIVQHTEQRYTYCIKVGGFPYGRGGGGSGEVET